MSIGARNRPTPISVMTDPSTQTGVPAIARAVADAKGHLLGRILLQVTAILCGVGLLVLAVATGYLRPGQLGILEVVAIAVIPSSIWVVQGIRRRRAWRLAASSGLARWESVTIVGGIDHGKRVRGRNLRLVIDGRVVRARIKDARDISPAGSTSGEIDLQADGAGNAWMARGRVNHLLLVGANTAEVCAVKITGLEPLVAPRSAIAESIPVVPSVPTAASTPMASAPMAMDPRPVIHDPRVQGLIRKTRRRGFMLLFLPSLLNAVWVAVGLVLAAFVDMLVNAETLSESTLDMTMWGAVIGFYVLLAASLVAFGFSFQWFIRARRYRRGAEVNRWRPVVGQDSGDYVPGYVPRDAIWFTDPNDGVPFLAMTKMRRGPRAWDYIHGDPLQFVRISPREVFVAPVGGDGISIGKSR